MRSQSTGWFLPCRRCRPTAFIIRERRCKKNGEKPLHFDNFSVLILWLKPFVHDKVGYFDRWKNKCFDTSNVVDKIGSKNKIRIMSYCNCFTSEDWYLAVLMLLSWIFHDNRFESFLTICEVFGDKHLFVSSSILCVKYLLWRKVFTCKILSEMWMVFFIRTNPTILIITILVMWSIYTSSVWKCIPFGSV